MKPVKFEVHILDKAGAMTMVEVENREAAEDLARRMEQDGAKVSIVEHEGGSPAIQPQST